MSLTHVKMYKRLKRHKQYRIIALEPNFTDAFWGVTYLDEESNKEYSVFQHETEEEWETLKRLLDNGVQVLHNRETIT